ncbi:unnamed protein product [Ilex paraguariensis]|uniref:Uncharacterized protein n=1 Tax=Ilex paraguariensis TaxID=185542 RepID=A0ABC8UWI5_9AQUA
MSNGEELVDLGGKPEEEGEELLTHLGIDLSDELVVGTIGRAVGASKGDLGVPVDHIGTPKLDEVLKMKMKMKKKKGDLECNYQPWTNTRPYQMDEDWLSSDFVQVKHLIASMCALWSCASVSPFLLARGKVFEV